MTGDGRRAQRVAHAINAHLGAVLSHELDDPKLAGLVITRVEVPDDLSLARVWVRLLAGDDDPKARRAAVRALEHAAGRLRRGMGTALGLRRVPDLRFEYDASHDASRRVDELLEEIAREPKAQDD
jgi:ribosome-binding factor A